MREARCPLPALFRLPLPHSLNPHALAQGKPGTANGSCAAGEDPSKALDASATTKWCARLTNGEAWLRTDLDRSMNIKRWVVRHAGYGGEPATWNTSNYALEYATTANRLRITTPTQTTDSAARIYALELYS